MAEVRIWHKYDPEVPPDAVYVGRPTKWGNRFSHTHGVFPPEFGKTIRVESREEAVRLHALDLLMRLQNEPELQDQIKRELGGKDLVCWCAPLSCHAEILAKVANCDGDILELLNDPPSTA